MIKLRDLFSRNHTPCTHRNRTGTDGVRLGMRYIHADQFRFHEKCILLATRTHNVVQDAQLKKSLFFSAEKFTRSSLTLSSHWINLHGVVHGLDS